MAFPIGQHLARALQGVDVRVEAQDDSYAVVLAGEDEAYQSSLFSASQARAIQQFLRTLRRSHASILHRTRREIVEACRRQHPNVPADTVRTVVGQALDESWEEDRLTEALARKSLAQTLIGYRDAGMWGVLIMSQRDDHVCPACHRLDTVAYDIDQALAEQPLPHAGCANHTCRCQYLPVVQKDDLYSTVETRVGA